MRNIEKINNIISEYNFSLSVLQDISQRISDCMMSYSSDEAKEQYIGQQVRYLKNILKSQENKTNKN